MSIPLFQIPTELLLEIISALDDYMGLTVTIPLVCRTLRKIILDSKANLRQGELARTLFTDTACDIEVPRSVILKNEIVPDVFKIHPAFGLLRAQVWLDQEAFRASKGKHVYYDVLQAQDLGYITPTGTFSPMVGLSLASENATSPACRRVEYEIIVTYYGQLYMDTFPYDRTGIGENEDGSAVTVAQLVELVSDTLYNTMFFGGGDYDEVEGVGSSAELFYKGRLFWHISVDTIVGEGVLYPRVKFYLKDIASEMAMIKS